MAALGAFFMVGIPVLLVRILDLRDAARSRAQMTIT